MAAAAGESDFSAGDEDDMEGGSSPEHDASTQTLAAAAQVNPGDALALA